MKCSEVSQSAATVRPGTPADEIAAHLPGAEAAMLAMGQSCLFQVREGDDALDALLAARGYAVMDPVVAFAAPVAALVARPLEMLRTFCVWPAIAAQAEIWAAGGIGPARRAVMARATAPKTTQRTLQRRRRRPTSARGCLRPRRARAPRRRQRASRASTCDRGNNLPFAETKTTRAAPRTPRSTLPLLTSN